MSNETDNTVTTSAPVIQHDAGPVSDVSGNQITKEAAIDEAINNFTVDDLLSLSKENYEEFGEDANHKNLKPLHEWMAHVPSDVRKHLANIRADYTRKTQELSKIRNELIESQNARLKQDETFLSGALAEKVKNVDVDAEYDLFDPEQQKLEIKRQAALMMAEMLAPAQQELQQQQRLVQLKAFKAEHPDIADPEIFAVVKKVLSETELSTEQAYYIAKGQIGETAAQKRRNAEAESKRMRRELVKKAGTGSPGRGKGVKRFKSALDAYKYHQSLGDK